MGQDLLSEAKLRKFSIFENLSAEEFETARSKLRLVRFAKGETIIGRLDEDADVYLLLEGQALANRYSASGREISYRRIPVNTYFGELAAFDGQPRSVNIIALTDVAMGYLPEAGFRELVRTSSAFTQALLEDLAWRIRDLSDRIYATAASSVKMRLYSELVRAAMAEGVEDNRAVLPDPPTHAEWAALVGGQRETVTRALSELVTSGLIEKQGRDLVVADVDGLLEQIEEA